jgi:outer membrane autotransporter protein
MVGQYGYHASENNRTIRYSGISGQADSDTNGIEYGINISLGKQWDINSWKFNPYARFEYLEVLIDNYNESSISGLAVSIDQVDGRSLKSVLGTQIGKAFSMPWGVIQPSVDFEWLHEFEANATNISGRFVEAAPGAGQFTLVSESPDRDYFNLGASVVTTFSEGRSIYFNHESRLGQEGINSYRFELGVRIPF